MENYLKDCPWYISAAAVRHYLAIGESGSDDGGPLWKRAQQEIALHERGARLISTQPRRSGPGDMQRWVTGKVQVMDRRFTTRIEFTVLTTPRAEGDKPQLTQIRKK